MILLNHEGRNVVQVQLLFAGSLEKLEERNDKGAKVIMEKYQVAVVKHREGCEVKDTVARAVGLIGGIEKFAKPGQTVMLKPNYTGLLSPDTGAVTSLLALEGITLFLQEHGITDITIADGCGTVHIGTQKIMDEVGVTALAEKLGVKTLDLNTTPMVEVKHEGYREIKSVKVSKAVLDADLVINVPVIKTHAMCGATAAMKNMKGCIAPAEKRRFHKIHLHQAIADLQLALPPYLTITDGLIAQEGLGPAEGTPVPLNIIMASENPVAMDGVILEIMQMSPDDVKHIKLAAEMGLGSIDLKDIDILGDGIDGIKRKFRPATTDIKEFDGVEIYECNACSGCIAALMITLGRLNAIGDLPHFKDIQVCVGTGKPANLKEYKNFFYIGKCAKAIYEKEHAKYPDQVHYIAGCAPAALEIEERIREVYNFDRSDPMFFTAGAQAVDGMRSKKEDQ